jgi:CheY-like chemotaxis protein
VERAESLAPNLPYLRRYARALTGSQKNGDDCVRAALSALLTGKCHLPADAPTRLALYRLFHIIWADTSDELNRSSCPEIIPLTPEQRLRCLPPVERGALLLTAVEGFSLSEAGKILGETPETVEQSIVAAQYTIEKQLASRVFIIEDESIIALDLENLVTELGHQVVGTAASKDEAVNKARLQQPDLILADVNLGEGGSGIDAVTEILRSFKIPVIFITAYPERLLTGERPEPTYIVTKPFLPETVQAVIGQALFFHTVRPVGA